MIATLTVAGARVVPFLLQAVQPSPGGMTTEQFNQQIALEAVRHNPATGATGVLVPLAMFTMVLGIVWLGMRQKQLRLQAKAEQAQEFLEWMEFISASVFAAGLAGWIGWNWYAIQSTLTLIMTEPTAAAAAVIETPNMFPLSAVILFVVAIVLGYPVLVRD